MWYYTITLLTYEMMLIYWNELLKGETK